MKTLIALVAFLFLNITGVYAQCAMCRATLENNVSNGDPGIAAGINIGIMYLFFAPYVAVGAVAFFWYKTTKSNARKELERRPVLR
ncbi:MAG: hypothetical protein KDC93_08615 [Cyclobacteriaceae bacterium]|jgi:hypothetical protein|nr:hypothetical protein [Cyclobacteriaceae bacterium]